MSSILTLGRKEPDYSIDINDLFEMNMIEAEKELIRREYAEGKLKTHPSIKFSIEYMQGKAKKDNYFYLRQIGKLPGKIRNELNFNYMKHLAIVKDYEEKRSKIGNAFICRSRYPELYKKYRISKICVDRYHRFFKGRWTVPSNQGNLVNQYRCLSCGVRLPKGVYAFMCQKCENNESEKFKDRGTWKTNILHDTIAIVEADLKEAKITFPEAYNEARHIFLNKITPIRCARRREFFRKWNRTNWADPVKKEILKERHRKFMASYKGRKYVKKLRGAK
jgi:hypothetical protein